MAYPPSLNHPHVNHLLSRTRMGLHLLLRAYTSLLLLLPRIMSLLLLTSIFQYLPLLIIVLNMFLMPQLTLLMTPNLLILTFFLPPLLMIPNNIFFFRLTCSFLITSQKILPPLPLSLLSHNFSILKKKNRLSSLLPVSLIPSLITISKFFLKKATLITS